MLLPEAIVCLDDAGALFVVNEVETAAKRRRKYETLKVEREQYEYLREAAAPADDLEGYYGDYEGGGSGAYDDYGSEGGGYGGGYGEGYGGGYGAGAGRRRSNPLSRRRSR